MLGMFERIYARSVSSAGPVVVGVVLCMAADPDLHILASLVAVCVACVCGRGGGRFGYWLPLQVLSPPLSLPAA